MITLVHLYPREMNIYGDTGNVIVRASYNHERGTDPVSGASIPDKLFKLDLDLPRRSLGLFI